MRYYSRPLSRAIATALLLVSATGHADPKAQPEQAEPQRAVADALNNISATYREQAKRAEAQNDTEPCEAGDDRRYSDLCAQWKAADAASDAARWSKLGFIAGAISLVGVIGALFISTWSNLIIRRTAKLELRAYLGVESVSAAPDGEGHITARVVVHNFGSTPAQSITAKIVGVVREFPSQALDGRGPKAEPQICPGSLHPGSDFELFAGASIRSLEAIFDGEDGFYVYGSIEYADFDSDHHRTDFCYRGTQSTLMNKGQMRVSFEGNAAT